MGGQAGKAGVPPEFQRMSGLGASLIRNTGGARRAALGQLEGALKGDTQRIPLIQQAISQSRQALSRGLTQTAGELASRNIGGPFASRILAAQRMGGEQQIAGTPTAMQQQIIQQFMPFLQGTQSLGFGALAQAGQASFASDVFNAQQFARAMGDVRSSLSSAGSSMGGA